MQKHKHIFYDFYCALPDRTKLSLPLHHVYTVALHLHTAAPTHLPKTEKLYAEESTYRTKSMQNAPD